MTAKNYNQDLSLISENMSRLITALIKNSKLHKSNKLSKNAITQIQKLVKSQSKQIYPHQILMIYNYLCYQQDENAFKALDHLFFPIRNDDHLLQPSLALSYRRLYCLAKYKAPFGSWITKVRDLVHETKLNEVDFKFIFNLGSFQNLRYHQDYISLYNDVISILDEQSFRFHTSNLSVIYNIIAKNTINNANLRLTMKKVEKQIDIFLPYLFFPQLKYLLKSRLVKESWMFQYFARSRGVSFNTFGFLQILLSRKHEWKEWVLNKYSRESIIDKLPSNGIPKRAELIIQGLFAHSSMDRDYIDQFFQFKKVDIQNKQINQLANPSKDYNNFLINAFYYLDSDLHQISIDNIQRINHIIKDYSNITKGVNAVCIYLTIKSNIIYYSSLQKQRKYQQQMQLIKSCLQLLNRCPPIEASVVAKFRLIPTKSIRMIPIMEFEIYKTPEFEQFYGKILSIYHQIYANFATGMYPSQNLQIQSIIKQYMTDEKHKQNHIFFGQIKKITLNQQHLQIQYAKNAQINFKVTVNNLVKIKDLVTGKQNKFLIDFKRICNTKCNGQIKHPIRNYWKKKYLTDWCGLNYIVQSQFSIQDFLRSQKFKAYAKQLLE